MEDTVLTALGPGEAGGLCWDSMTEVSIQHEGGGGGGGGGRGGWRGGGGEGGEGGREEGRGGGVGGGGVLEEGRDDGLEKPKEAKASRQDWRLMGLCHTGPLSHGKHRGHCHSFSQHRASALC